MTLTTQWPTGSRSPHPEAPYRATDDTHATPHNAVFVASNARMEDAPQLIGGNRHNKFDFVQTKYYGDSLGGPTLIQEQGTMQHGDERVRREAPPWHLTLNKFERLLGDAVQGVALSKGRVVPESIFTDGLDTIRFLDTIKGTELLVQTVSEGNLVTKVIDAADIDPMLAKALKKLNA